MCFSFPPTLTMMHLCIAQCTYWTPLQTPTKYCSNGIIGPILLLTQILCASSNICFFLLSKSYSDSYFLALSIGLCLFGCQSVSQSVSLSVSQSVNQSVSL